MFLKLRHRWQTWRFITNNDRLETSSVLKQLRCTSLDKVQPLTHQPTQPPAQSRGPKSSGLGSGPRPHSLPTSCPADRGRVPSAVRASVSPLGSPNTHSWGCCETDRNRRHLDPECAGTGVLAVLEPCKHISRGGDTPAHSQAARPEAPWGARGPRRTCPVQSEAAGPAQPDNAQAPKEPLGEPRAVLRAGADTDGGLKSWEILVEVIADKLSHQCT